MTRNKLKRIEKEYFDALADEVNDKLVGDYNKKHSLSIVCTNYMEDLLREIYRLRELAKVDD
jgi:hypothetical protein